ncbi:glycoside hydrolase family 79 protein [Cordyceps fumosorosea ARSEF 2679]|uniref:Glycoside hydrolase family 79 protein n=1 Tax=Cordyceps fumosorosea (strain ARSEF 2679) TaxID=1081104 RepID=A0A162JDK9_CORFA|nr:glycoside hydrolase family 79 protein [Cordyceps fumosorosea ARSEF 2679]OAA67392.1 glycoside hydrolase family 79 protein [Cordyceps fumosorosea ARSEF 2679]
MVKSLTLAAVIVPSVWAINTDGRLYSSFVSLSIELIGFPDWAETAPSTTTLTTPTASSCRHADPGAWQCIGPRFFDSYGAFPAGTLYSHNFNVATWNASGFHTLEATVPLACSALRGQLSLFEIGNEPDLYVGKRRDSNYDVHDYLADWANTTARFEHFLKQACPDMASEQQLHYMFPSVSSPVSRLRVPDMFAAAVGGSSSSIKRVTQVSVHNYMAGATQPGVTLQATLMNHTAVARSLAGHVAYAKSVEASDADYVIGEHNSLYGAGAAGLSDVFGAALWGVDFALQAAATGVVKRVHFTSLSARPTPRGPRPRHGRRSRRTTVKTLALGGRADLDSGYGAYVDGRLERLALLNLREWSRRRTGRSKRLSAAAACDKTGITFNGFAYEAETMDKPARVASRASNEQVKADKSGKLAIEVADSEAIVVLQK